MDSTIQDKQQPLSERIATELIAHIVQSGLQQGDKLPNEKVLCEQLNVGRSTLREAVRMLASRNILVVKHGSGIYVSDKPGLSDDPLGLAFIRDKERLVLDLVDFRLMVEPRTAALAAQKADSKQLQELKDLALEVESLIAAKKSHARADAAFHTKLGELSGNLIMPNLEPILFSSIELFAHMCTQNSREETISSHRQIVKAIESHDAIGAMDAMVMHLTLNRNSLIYFIKQVHP
ncbi:MAG: FadR family transcriptional regulator [Candidatus Anaerobiospirillum merdipullorum]|uniref:FadR family transcriptional regulator n=1 Tax=Candidatus Anaerobiospirillum merdipullorum TaxID=2838450 RepID=A0A9E2KQ88_9GAMM|nr:FadR family transcriptional regulator [Candidatus Anaerobiospirillum merdipullorum]